MAVIYSKLGGCLGGTAKLGPLVRTKLWAGVKGLLDKLMTHLGLGSSLEDPWGSLLGVGVGLPSQEFVLSAWDSAILLGRLGCPMPEALPAWPSLIACLTCLEIATSFPRGRMGSCLGRTTTSFPRRKVSSCLGRTASFPRRKVGSCLGSTASFPRRKVSSSLGRTASFPRSKVSSCQGKIASFPRRKVSNCLGDTASFPRRKVSSGLRWRIAAFPWEKVST